MSRHDAVLRWSSPTWPDRQAAELLSCTSDGRGLEPAMRRVARQLVGARFLVVNVGSATAADLHAGIDAFHEAGGDSRVCLAGTRWALGRLEHATFDHDQVGLMLDAVDADTPLTDVIWDGVEAVRFNPGFVAAAARDVRLGCVLQSMLGLARDIGLCTLGADDLPGGGSLDGRADFDYVPVERSHVEARRRSSAARQIQFPVDTIHEHAQRR